MRPGGEQRRGLLNDAISAYRSALAVWTREEFPTDWAQAQNNIGFALAALGAGIGSPEQEELFVKAIAAFESALKVFTLEGAPS
jgi:hypothetical protein